MQEMQREVDGNLEEKSRATAKSDGQSITVEATKIALDLSSLKDKAKPTHAQLRAELIGLKGASLAPGIAGDAIPLEDGSAEIAFEATFIVPAGSALRKDVEAAHIIWYELNAHRKSMAEKQEIEVD